jgi:hypothetical protein
VRYPADERGQSLEVVLRQVRSDELDLVWRHGVVHFADEVLFVETQSHLRNGEQTIGTSV